PPVGSRAARAPGPWAAHRRHAATRPRRRPTSSHPGTCTTPGATSVIVIHLLTPENTVTHDSVAAPVSRPAQQGTPSVSSRVRSVAVRAAARRADHARGAARRLRAVPRRGAAALARAPRPLGRAGAAAAAARDRRAHAGTERGRALGAPAV